MEPRPSSPRSNDDSHLPIRSAATVLVIPAVILGVLAAAAAFALPFADDDAGAAHAAPARR